MMCSLRSTTAWLAGLLAILSLRCVEAASSVEDSEAHSSRNGGCTGSVVRELAGLAPIVQEADSLVSRSVSPRFGFNAFHVQGLLVTKDCFYVTSVHALKLEGWIFKLSRKTMKLLGRRQLAIGKDIHPGGIDFDGERIWVPVAAYRKHSHTHIMAVDPTTLEAKTQFQVDDHIGAVARSNDRLIGANWGAEQFYFWTLAGRLVAKKPSPTGIAYQDCKGCGDTIACLGGGYLDWIDVKRWRLVKRLSVGRSRSGASLSREGLGLFGDSVFFLPDDGPAARIYEYGFGGQNAPTSTQRKSAKTSATTRLFVAPDTDDARPTGLDSDPHLVGWWKMDDASGVTATDSSKHRRKGTLKGGLSFDKDSVQGRIGKALKFDGKQAVEVTGYKGVTGMRPRTVAAWVKTRAADGEILSWGLDEPGRMWVFGFIESRSRVGVTPCGGYLYMNDAVHDDAWHHVAVVVGEAKLPNLSDNVRLYKDGARAKIHDIGLLDLYPIDTGSKLDVRIGHEFKGLIDDIRIYDRALSEKETEALFRRGLPK